MRLYFVGIGDPLRQRKGVGYNNRTIAQREAGDELRTKYLAPCIGMPIADVTAVTRGEEENGFAP